MRDPAWTWMTVLACGLALSCGGDQIADGGPSECIGGDLCVGDLVCVDGFCVPPGDESGESSVGESGDGDGDPGDGDPGDGDGDPGDGDPGDGDPGDGDGDGDPACGDGVEDPGEACDDGNTDNTDTCLNTCELASCGDGHVGPGEGCDDANLVDDDECTNSCALTSCGDGVTQVPEQCDDDNNDNNDECLSTCVDASCGDGFIQQGVEGCDDANPNDVDACLSTCVDASCGDGFTQQGVEDCDDSNMENDDACVSGCVLAECGDGFVEQGVEDCDDANMIDDDACSNACALASCGDGVVQQGEGCDDADLDDTDACLQTCVAASCGDGFIQLGVDDCDDGNANDDDACLQTCVAASCGDGFVEQGVEACDDGNLDNTDACSNSCAVASCGDAILQQGEGCDEGNANDNHADCTDSCQVAVCGDAVIWTGVEECDDGNMVANDGCDACDGASTVTITRGANHTCLMLVDGSVRCWGYGGYLGDGAINDIGDGPGEMPPAPIDVGGVAMQLHTGGSFNCVLLVNGELRCWGSNLAGQLGHGTVLTVGDAPGEMPPPPTNVGGEIAQLTLGSAHACVLLVNGQVRCWGNNSNGQLGLGHANPIGDMPGEMPPPAVNFGTGNVVQLRAGNSHTCVLLDTNKVRCWGRNHAGQLGLGHINTIGDGPGEMPPADLILGGVAISQIGPCTSATCVLYNGGALRCFGSGLLLGQGTGNSIGDAPGEMPPLVTNYGIGVVSELHGANGFFQILLADGSVRNWGEGLSLGYGSLADVGDGPNEMPPSNVSLGGSVISLTDSPNGQHSCAVLQDMTVRCWGHNASGQLGYGHSLEIGDGPNEMPPPPVPAF